MELFGFDKYAPYVLTVYGLAIVLLVANAWTSSKELARVKAKVLRRLKQEQSREQGAQNGGAE